MPGNRQGVILVIMPIHVRNLEIGLKDGCFQSHKRFSCVYNKDVKNSRFPGAASALHLYACDNIACTP